MKRESTNSMDVVEIKEEDIPSSSINYLVEDLKSLAKAMESHPLIYIMSEQEKVKNKADILKKQLKKQKKVNKQKKVQSRSVHRLEVPDKQDKTETVVIRKLKTQTTRENDYRGKTQSA